MIVVSGFLWCGCGYIETCSKGPCIRSYGFSWLRTLDDFVL